MVMPTTHLSSHHPKSLDISIGFRCAKNLEISASNFLVSKIAVVW